MLVMDRVLNGATLEMKVRVHMTRNSRLLVDPHLTLMFLRAFSHTKRLSVEIKHFYPTRRKSQQFYVKFCRWLQDTKQLGVILSPNLYRTELQTVDDSPFVFSPRKVNLRYVRRVVSLIGCQMNDHSEQMKNSIQLSLLEHKKG